MPSISITYILIWQFKINTNYKMTRCRKVFNTQRGSLVKCTLNGGSVGWWIGSDKFIPKSKVNENIELIPVKEKLQF
jgi:hypothetical protein